MWPGLEEASVTCVAGDGESERFSSAVSPTILGGYSLAWPFCFVLFLFVVSFSFLSFLFAGGLVCT